MSLAPRLDLRQSQALVMTPQLQQAIKLLQMSNVELGEFVAGELENNPLLERDEGPADPAESAEFVPTEPEVFPVSSTTSVGDPVPLSENVVSEMPAVSDGHESGSEDNIWDSDRPSGGESFGAQDNRFDSSDAFSAAEHVAAGISLRDHLLGQIQVDFTKADERLIAVALIDLLDEAGYLPPDLGLARAQLGATQEVFEEVIGRLQHLDPPGIFARSLEECLAIQLRDKNRYDPAMQVLVKNLDLVAKNDKPHLMKRCGVDAEDLAQMLQELRSLNPKPATAFSSELSQPITPDVTLRAQAGGGWHVELNADNLPRVLANEHYYTTVRHALRAAPDKAYISERWQQANWLVKALHQRATTILKVAAEIVKQQDAFFVHGVQHLKPLILRDVAAAVEMHESTISRVTRNKYIATPRGLFELKYFFSASLGTTGGTESVSSRTVQDRIKSLIDSEASSVVLSDDRIAAMLRTEGIDVARRTVAKYREGLHIPSSAQRRRVKRA